MIQKENEKDLSYYNKMDDIVTNKKMSNIVDIKITDVLTNDEDVTIKAQFITTIEKVEITVENLTIAESAVDVARDMLTKIDSMDLKD